MNYDEADDFEINKAIAESIGLKLSNYFDDDYGYTEDPDDSGMFSRVSLLRVKDYCNNPSDMWPIILEHGIITYPRKNEQHGQSYARNYSGTCKSFCKDRNKVLRAAAIVYLKMMEAKNGQSN